MGCEVIAVNQNTWRIENEGVRFFLLTGREKALLIDTGMTAPDARRIAEGLTDLPLFLLNTHSDRDHISGNGAFSSLYMHPAEEEHYRAVGGDGTVIPIRDGEELDLGDRPLEIIHLPGHTPGSVAVLDVKARTLISGDPIQEDGRIFMFGDHRDMETYIESLIRLQGRIDEFDQIWPSHTRIPVSPARISDLIEGAGKVLSGRIQGRPAQLFGQEILVYDLGFTVLLGGR